MLEKRLAEACTFRVPTLTIEGDANAAPHPEPSAYAKKVSGSDERRLKASQAFAEAVTDIAQS
jgi:hypothetical protein